MKEKIKTPMDNEITHKIGQQNENKRQKKKIRNEKKRKKIRIRVY